MDRNRTVAQWLESITAELHDAAERPRREAELLLMAYLQRDQLWLITHQNEPVAATHRLEAWIQRRRADEPLEYITNRVSFYSQIFHIERGALIPRPETELLIDKVLEKLDRESNATIVEVGVGSGVISIILAQHLPNANIIAVDISDEALAVAAKNIEAAGLQERIELRRSDLLDSVEEKIDLLVSNPPYIAENAGVAANLSYEPERALYGGREGDEVIRRLLDEVDKRHISRFVCEMGYDQKHRVEAYVSSFALKSLEFYSDLAGFDRGFILQMDG
jgi:release factor glutamine methyltransferase